VVVIDLGKGALAAAGLPALVKSFDSAFSDPLLLGAVAGYAAVIGHIWPLYFRLRGGKGAGTAVGVIAVLAPWCVLPLLLVWLIVLLGSGYVGLATMLAGLSLLPSRSLLGPQPEHPALGTLAIALAVLLLFTHRSNLARMRSGTENRFERFRLHRWRKR